jgi:uncharacterized coiled-coil protein SlyX
MKNRKTVCAILILLAVLVPGQPATAQDDALEPVGDAGSIDWVGQKLVATGTGVATAKAVNRAQGLAMAQRAAQVVARRNLLEVVKGVHIDSTTRVENFVLKNDTIETRVRGFLRNSRIEDTRVISDTEVEVTVSMPMTGDLGRLLMEMAVEAPAGGSGATGSDLEGRLKLLEERVRTLEQRIGRIGKVNLEQEEMILFFRQLVAAWSTYAATHPQLARAAYASDGDLEGLKHRIAGQESQLTRLTGKLDAMAKRLAALESGTAKPAAARSKARPGLYTGLVIDARGLGFRPCLKPEVYGAGKQVYPSADVDRSNAVRKGYIRYYRQVTRAQKSKRVGSLPLTIRATGTGQGTRSLEIAPEDAQTLNAMAGHSGNFLARCQVVIVF